MKYLIALATAFLLYASAFAQGCSTNYVDPNFQLQVTNLGCLPNSGRIEAVNITDGVGPFTFKLVETGATNNTGLFTNLGVGLYTVELRDNCGTVRTRQVTLVPWSFAFTYTVAKTSTCSDGTVTIVATPASSSYQYGVAVNGDTTWSTSPVVAVKLNQTMNILVKDACGIIHSQVWHAPSQFLPYISELQHRLQCDKFDLFPVFYGFNQPKVCLYRLGTNALIECKQAPAGNYTGGAATNFFDLPWGDYYVIVSDSCFRDSMYHPDLRSSGGTELNPYDWDCNTFKLHVDGPPPPAAFFAANPTVYGHPDSVCLFRKSDNSLVGCKSKDDHLNWINPRTNQAWPSGAVWDNLPYGGYYAYIFDPCDDTTYRIDSVITYPFKVQSAATGVCDFNKTAIKVAFDPGTKAPCTVSVFYPNGALAGTSSSQFPTNSIAIPLYPGGGNLKVICSDGCGNGDTSYVTQVHTEFTKVMTVQQKCPGVNGSGGSGDINVATYVSEAYIQTIPHIIKIDGRDTSIAYSFSTSINNGGQNFVFANLLTGRYIVQYTFIPCSENTYYDTVDIVDYIYPTQNPYTVYQCGVNEFSFTFPVIGGLTPYTFQIVGSTPTTPSIITPVRNSPTFNIGNSQHYTEVKVRAIDRCGNSTIGDVTVDQVAGCSILEVDNDSGSPVKRGNTFKIFPNPSRGKFTLAFTLKRKADYRVSVINASGTVLIDHVLRGIERKELAMGEGLAAGVYFIKIMNLQTGDTTVAKQMIY